MVPAEAGPKAWLAGSYSSAVFRAPPLVPPAIRTFPFVNRVAVWPYRWAASAPVVATKLGGSTVKPLPLLATPLTVTTTLPVVAPAGTEVTIEPAVHEVIVVAATPLKVIVPALESEPKLAPVMVTGSPTLPEFGERDVIPGIGSTVNDAPLLGTPLTMTTTLPGVAEAGTAAVIEPALQLVIDVAATPLKVTVLEL